MDFGDHILGARSIFLELRNDGANVPANVGDGSMCVLRQG